MSGEGRELFGGGGSGETVRVRARSTKVGAREGKYIKEGRALDRDRVYSMQTQTRAMCWAAPWAQ